MKSFSLCFKSLLIAYMPAVAGGFAQLLVAQPLAKAPVSPRHRAFPSTHDLHNNGRHRHCTTRLYRALEVQVEATLNDEKIRALFAWIAQAYAGEYEYNNLMLAFAAIFGNLPENSEPVQLSKKALKKLPKDAEEIPFGEPFSLYERESNSLGAMG